MIVIAVIGVLMAIAAPNFARSMRQGKERALRADLSIVRSAISAFFADTGCFPNSLSDLSLAVTPANCVSADSASRSLNASSFKGPYLPFIPHDAVSRADFTYTKPGGAVPYVRSSAAGSDLNGNAFSSY